MTVVNMQAGSDSATGEANRLAIQNALDNEADGGTITIPEPVGAPWYVQFNLAPVIALEVNKNVTIEFPGGPLKNIVQFGPEAPASLYYGFRLNPVEARIRFKGGCLRGPADPGVLNGEGVPTIYMKAIYADAFEVGRLELEDMNTEGAWYSAVDGNKNTQPGWWTWELKNCDLTARMNGVALFCSYATDKVAAHLYDCRIHDVGLTGADPTVQQHGALGYLHPNVSWHAERCRFERNYRWGVQHNGAGNPDLPPLYCRYVDCNWEDVRVAALLPDTGLAVIDNPTVDCHYQAFLARNDLTMTGGRITIGPGLNTTSHIGVAHYSTNYPMYVQVRGTHFYECTAISAGGDGARWSIEGIKARNTSKKITSLISNVPAMAVNVELKHSRLENQFITAQDQIAAIVYPRNGDWKIERNNIKGTALYAGIFGEGNLQEALVNRNTFDLPNKLAVRIDAGQWEVGPNRYLNTTIQPSILDKRVRQVVA